MKRLAMISAIVAVLLAGAGSAAAVAAQPSPGPSIDANTKQVCEKSGKTVDEGIRSFTAELDRAGNAATGGDLAGADRHVKQSGTVLTDLAGKLRKDGEQAKNQDLKAAIGDVAKELDVLGTGLTGLTSLQNLDTDRLETLSERVSQICGTN